MIWDIFAWIGMILCVISLIIVLVIALALFYDMILESCYTWRIDHVKKNYEYTSKKVTVLHLHELKKKYPELEITFNDKEIK